ncbi:MAG: hypothetical protein AAF739_17335 [Pseudomonadota bacterium]
MHGLPNVIPERVRTGRADSLAFTVGAGKVTGESLWEAAERMHTVRTRSQQAAVRHMA